MGYHEEVKAIRMAEVARESLRDARSRHCICGDRVQHVCFLIDTLLNYGYGRLLHGLMGECGLNSGWRDEEERGEGNNLESVLQGHCGLPC